MLPKKSNLFLTYNKVTLYREVNKKLRYYSFYLYPTLFGEFLLLREFGGMNNKKPTGIIKEYFYQMEDSVEALSALVRAKMKKGYFQTKNFEEETWTEK